MLSGSLYLFVSWICTINIFWTMRTVGCADVRIRTQGREEIPQKPHPSLPSPLAQRFTSTNSNPSISLCRVLVLVVHESYVNRALSESEFCVSGLGEVPSK